MPPPDVRRRSHATGSVCEADAQCNECVDKFGARVGRCRRGERDNEVCHSDAECPQDASPETTPRGMVASCEFECAIDSDCQGSDSRCIGGGRCASMCIDGPRAGTPCGDDSECAVCDGGLRANQTCSFDPSRNVDRDCSSCCERAGPLYPRRRINLSNGDVPQRRGVCGWYVRLHLRGRCGLPQALVVSWPIASARVACG